MATITSIAEAIRDTLVNNVDDIDYGSIDSYMPSIHTRKVALLIVPFAQVDRLEALDYSKAHIEFEHRIRCELWVKHVQGSIDDTMQRAREIGLSCMTVLATHDESNGYVLAPAMDLEAQVADGPITAANADFIPVTLTVPVLNIHEVT